MLFGWKSLRARAPDWGALCAEGTGGALRSADLASLAGVAEALVDARAEAAIAAPVINDFNTLRRDGRSDM
jgi:hypothetical protein